MSTATRFQHHRPFPFCPSVPVMGIYKYDTVYDLSLEAVMRFYWNLKSVTFTFAATATMIYDRPHEDPLYYYTHATGTIGIGPPQATGDFLNLVVWLASGAAIPYYESESHTFSDVPFSTTSPRERICGGSTVLSLRADYDWPTTAAPEFPTLFRSDFVVRSDPDRPGRFAIEYRLDALAGNYYLGGTPGRLGWSNPANISTSHPPYIVNTGSFTIGGVSFPYVCFGNAGSYPISFTYTGGTMSATSSDYTYPP